MIWHSSAIDSVLNELSVDKDNGLANGVAYERLDKYGKNQITEIKPVSYISRFLSHLNSKSVYALVIISLISFVVSIVYQLGDYYSPFLIIAIVLLNAIITAYYEHICDRSLYAQKVAAIPTCKVVREGIERLIPSNELAVGDIILLNEGDYVCADARLIETSGFRCNEIALTGETVPVEKDADAVIEDMVPVEGRKTMVFAGTSVIHGSAKAVVVETGLNTESGKLNAIQSHTETAIPVIEKKLSFTSHIINIAVVITCVIVFFIGMIIGFSSAAPFASITAKNLLNCIALGICAIPESLPIITVIVISIGTGRLIHDGIIIKNAAVIENLSKTTVLCADKTGVFTKNHMSVSGIYNGENTVYLSSSGADPKSAVILRLAAACSMLKNDSTESAITEACLSYCKMSSDDVNNVYPRLASIPFDSERKTMTSINMVDGKPLAIVKGAPEIVIDKCVGIDKDAVLKDCDKFAGKSLRLICIAIKALDDIPANPNAEEIENGLKFAGILCLYDPPRVGAAESVEICRKNGINVIMVTGDNLNTACAVAQNLGILYDESQSVTGQQIEEMTDEELKKNIPSYTVFARISPAQKLKIVKALQDNGEVVTVTGDGVEDADVLSVADVGIAIGANGHDVARGNADAIVKNNDFSSIANVFSHCRRLLVNIKNTVHYLISCNVSEVIYYVAGLLIFKIPPLLAVQLLWINLLTDSLPAISIAVQSSDDYTNFRTDNIVKGKFFERGTVIDIIIQAFSMALSGVIAFSIGNIYGRTVAYTMAFFTISLSQILHSFNLSSSRSVIFTRFKRNEFMIFSSLFALFISLFLCATPAGSIFGMAPLTALQLLIAFALSLLITAVCEIKKIFNKHYMGAGVCDAKQ